MTWLLVALVVGSTAIGEVAITRGMKQTGEIDDFRPGAWLGSLGRAFLNPWLMLGVGGMTVAFFSFLILVSHEDLSFSVPATASTVVAQTLGARFTALLSHELRATIYFLKSPREKYFSSHT